MRLSGGYATLTDGRGTREADTFTCVHCNRIIHVKPKAEVGWCNLCFKPICPACQSHGKCDPFERKLERIENKARFLCEALDDH